MNTYRFDLSPTIARNVLPASFPELAAESFVQTIVGCAVRELTTNEVGGYQVDVALTRQSHATALDELASFVEQWGFSLAEAIVTEWVTSTLPVAAMGGASGVGLGVFNDNPALGFLAGMGLGLLGAALGSLHLRPSVVYYAQQIMLTPRAWQLTRLQEDGQGGWAPAPA